MILPFGDMAQLVERCVRNAQVRGSNPLISTKPDVYEPDDKEEGKALSSLSFSGFVLLLLLLFLYSPLRPSG